MEKNDIQKKGLNSNQLKIIAIIAMTIDHTNKILLNPMRIMQLDFIFRIIGRITIPIMCFFISEGYFHTRNKKRYIGRLFIFSIISHFAYCFAFKHPMIPKNIFFETSVIWTLLWGLIALCIIKKNKINNVVKILLIFLIFCLCVNSDWGIFAIAAILAFGITRGNIKNQMVSLSIVSLTYMITQFMENHNIYQFIQYFGLFLTIPFLLKYNGERGNCKSLKWLFYIYYPLHLVILGIIRNLIIVI